LAPKTVHDIHRALSALLETAVADEIIDVNPAKNKHVRDLLPELDDTQGPVYEPDEVWELTTNPLVPSDRQILYAGCAFAGQRIGESAGLRRSNINWDAPILPELAIVTQYQDQLLKSAQGKARKPRFAPMHAAYNRKLTPWIAEGYEAVYRRPMPADGFLAPDRRDPSRARTRNQLLSRHRRDCKVLGIEHKGTHALRRYFSTFSVADGADEAMIERITHNPKGSVLRRSYIVDKHLWRQLCKAVLCLKVDISRGQVIEMGGRRGV
jgi:integrase